MRSDRLIIYLIFLLVLISCVSAEAGHIKLLAVAESDGKYTGRIADLSLEIIKGQGRVFLETYPLTKFDTQISTRFAKQISCDFLDADCSKYDFIYVIKSDTGIIGGPSAGGATAVLTSAMLKGLSLKSDVAMTGTINSGGIIGPVSGLMNKIEAASRNGIKTVLIPKGTRYVSADEYKASGLTFMVNDKGEVDLVEYGKSIGLEVVEVITVSEALEYFTGISFKTAARALVINSEYQSTMKGLAGKLCTRSKTLQEELSGLTLSESLKDSAKQADEFYSVAMNESADEKYYSAASRCFTANIKYSYIKKSIESIGKDAIIGQAKLLNVQINKTEAELKKRSLKTMMDLQTYMVVKERLEDSRVSAIKAEESGSEYDYVYAIERYESANAWSSFFGKRGLSYPMDEEDLQDTCSKKLSEAEERIQYVSNYIPQALEGARVSYDKAKSYADSGEYILCIFKASLTKAEADTLYNMLTVPMDKLDEIIRAKLDITKEVIAKEASLGSFPILGYSYYEYAGQLLNGDKYSALLDSEYALEMSSLRMYFTSNRNVLALVLDSDYKAVMLVLGIGIGIFIGVWLSKRK
ncbi:MAG: S16 family serine protease [Candidatus Woesearchaeota archaeon]